MQNITPRLKKALCETLSDISIVFGTMNRKQVTSLLLLAASVIYDLLPADLIPDMPFIGWIDDTLVTSSALINCVQQFSDEGNKSAQRIMKWLKWTCLVLAVLVILVVMLLASTIMTLLK